MKKHLKFIHIKCIIINRLKNTFLKIKKDGIIIMKKTLSIALSAMLLLATFSGCTSANSTDNTTPQSTDSTTPQSTEQVASGSEISKVPTLEEIQAGGKLVVATNATFAPFEYIFENKPVGVDMDVANEIATELGVESEILDLEFASIIESVKTGKANIAIAGITKNEERLKQVDMSDEYITSAQYLITTKDSKLISENLEEAIIGVQEGTTGDLYASDEVITKEVKRYSAIATAANDLINGRIDGIIIDKLPADNIIATTGDKLKIEDTALTEESYAIVVAKGNTALLDVINGVIAKLKEQGKIDEFLLKHIEQSAIK